MVRDFGLELTFISPQNFYGDTAEVDPKEAKAANADYPVSLDLSAARRSRWCCATSPWFSPIAGAKGWATNPGTRLAVGSPAAALPKRILWW